MGARQPSCRYTSRLGLWHQDSATHIVFAIALFQSYAPVYASLVRRHGGVVLGVPVAHRPRIAGTSKYRILDRLFVGISDVLGVIWLLRRAPAQGAVHEVMAPPPANKKTKSKEAAR